MGQPTRAELAKTVAELTAKLTNANTAQTTQAAAYAALQQTLTEQVELFNDAQARAQAAEAEAQAATAAAADAQAQADAAAAAAAAAPPPPPQEPEPIPKPRAQRYNIREAMQLDDQDYLTIRATIHDLVKSAQLNWKAEFRHQDPSKLGNLFKAARKEHPVLRRYIGDWATAVIAKTYMQNMRKYARRRGYIPPWKPGGDANNANGGRAN